MPKTSLETLSECRKFESDFESLIAEIDAMFEKHTTQLKRVILLAALANTMVYATLMSALIEFLVHRAP